VRTPRKLQWWGALRYVLSSEHVTEGCCAARSVRRWARWSVDAATMLLGLHCERLRRKGVWTGCCVGVGDSRHLVPGIAV
jgi:hypothetical protein